MNRLLIALAILLTALVLSDHLLQRQRQRERALASQLISLTHLEAAQVATIRVRIGQNEWVYVRRDGHWRYPAYHDAFALPNRIDQLLTSLGSLGTIVSTDREADAHYGLTGPQAIDITVENASGEPLLQARVGRGAPTAAAAESYVRPVSDHRQSSSDTILHLHANPHLALGRPVAGGGPPMLDPQVLPRALERRSLAQIDFVRQGQSWSLRRIEIEPLEQPGSPALGKEYTWVMTRAGRVDTCLSANAFAYTGFLRRLRYDALHDPQETAPAFAGQPDRIELIDEEGNVDRIEIGRQWTETRLLRHSATGQVLSVSNDKADLLFPSRSALLDSLARPTPYERVEPFGGR